MNSNSINDEGTGEDHHMQLDEKVTSSQVESIAEDKRLKRIKAIFLILFCSNFIANFDHGIIPALNTTLKEEYGLNSVQMGSLGSVVYFGNVIGSILGMPLFRRINTKILLMASLGI
mmetsp:Transcript_99547/g.136792  ORF Transcript_99547/g.136792 Transcript_99547/m.136792 type:complete len:117 (+) Transcript_99547:19-369(+)